MELASSFIILLLLTGGSVSELQEYEEDPAFNTTEKSMPGGNALGLQKHEEDPNDEYEELFEKLAKQSGNCSFQAVYDYLELTKKKDMFTMSRPVKHFNSVTNVRIHVVIIAILGVREIDQSFTSHIRVIMMWKNEHIYWKSSRFCGLKTVKVPTGALWKPDLTIEEMVEKDKVPVSPYLEIHHLGFVRYHNDQIVVSTCKMRVFRFPFDIQRCTISLRSTIYNDGELKFYFSDNNDTITNLSLRVMHTQYEWLFLKMTVNNKTDSIFTNSGQTSVIYTIYMKRKSVLYIANFIVPILFFLCLDLSSFLISDRGGEKLSFKVTVLLAITVMQLILNDILPSSSDRIPLIVVYCIGIFVLMMLSLLETILVMYLIEKDATSRSNETNRDLNLNRCKLSCFKGKKCANSASVSDVSTDQTPSNTKEDSSSQMIDLSLALGKVSTELEQIEKTMAAMGEEKEEKSSDYWARVAKQINKVFVTVYITAAIVFLAVIFSLWTN